MAVLCPLLVLFTAVAIEKLIAYCQLRQQGLMGVIQKHGRKLADLQNFCISASFLSILPKLTQNVMELSRIFCQEER